MKQNNTGYTFCLFHKNLYFDTFLKAEDDDRQRHFIGNDFYFSKNLTYFQFRWLNKLENNETCYLYKSKKGAK